MVLSGVRSWCETIEMNCVFASPERRSLEPSRDRRTVFSLNERADNIAGQDWIFANGQLLGRAATKPDSPNEALWTRDVLDGMEPIQAGKQRWRPSELTSVDNKRSSPSNLNAGVSTFSLTNGL
jgi:hypothetical protein